MRTYIIVVESTDPSRTYSDLGKTLSKEIETKARPCHVLNNLWCVRSDKSGKDILGLLSSKVVHPNDKFVIALIDEPWLMHNAKSQDDCFDLNE